MFFRWGIVVYDGVELWGLYGGWWCYCGFSMYEYALFMYFYAIFCIFYVYFWLVYVYCIAAIPNGVWSGCH